MATPQQPKARAKTLPAADGLRRLPGVVLFTAGIHRDMAGRTRDYPRDYLEGVVKTTRALRDDAEFHVEPPAVLGHEHVQAKLAEILSSDATYQKHFADKKPSPGGGPGRTDQLAAGWPENVRLDGDRIVADLERIPPSVADLIDSGQLRYPSVEFQESAKRPDGTPVPPHLFRLALLGGTPPGNKSVPPLGQAHFAAAPPGVLCFADATGDLPAETDHVPTTGVPPMANPTPTPPAPDPKAELIAFADSLRAEIRAELTEREKALDAKAAAITKAADAALATSKARDDAEWAATVRAFCEAQSKAPLNRIMPSELDPKDPENLERRLLAIPADELYCFADAAGNEVRKSRRQVELDAIKRRSVRAFGDRLNADTGDPDAQPLTAERRKELLAHTPTGRAILKDEAALNGRGH